MRYNRLYRETNYLTPTLYTQQLSEYTQELRYEDLPAQVVERVKLILLQTVGAALAAGQTEIAGRVRVMGRQANGGLGGPTTVWGSGERLAAPHGALILATLADTLSWEPCSPTGNPAACAIPCAWLAAEERHKSGKDLIAAIVAAFEVYGRIAMAVQPSEQRWAQKGWGKKNWAIFSAILPVAKLYGLNARRINQAIGVGCECSTLPTDYAQTTLSDFSHYEYGYRARDGFMITKAVEKGIHNQRDALDDPRCYTGIVCGDESANGDDETTIHADESDLCWLTKGLGESYLILDTILRQFPGDIWVQSGAELAREIQRTHPFRCEQVERIVVDPPVEGRMWSPTGGMSSDLQAQCSIPFVIASVLAAPVPGAQWYSPQQLGDREVLELAGKVQAGTSPERTVCASYKAYQQGGYPGQAVTVCLKDGTQYRAQTDCPIGCPKNLPDAQAAQALFCCQAGEVLAQDAARRAAETLFSIEACPDIACLSGLLGSGVV